MSDDPHDRTIATGFVFAVCVLVDGFLIGFATRERNVTPAGVALFVVASATIVATTQSFRKPRPLPCIIYAEVKRLAKSGRFILLPQVQDTAETAYLRIAMNGGVAVIERIGWCPSEILGSTVRRYEIWLDGRLRQSVSGPQLSAEDMEWCDRRLTKPNLEYILHVLRHERYEDAYEPLKLAVSR